MDKTITVSPCRTRLQNCRCYHVLRYGISYVIAKVNEWIDLHEAEILTLWEKAQRGEKIGRIEPLK